MDKKLKMKLSIFVLSMLFIKTAGQQQYLPAKFWEVYNSLEGPEGAAIKVKIYQGQVWSFNKLYADKDFFECYPRLIKFIENDLMCPRAGRNLIAYLNIMEFVLNSFYNEKITQSIFKFDCTHFNGKNAKICHLITSRDTYHVGRDEFSKTLDNCQSEHLEHNTRNNELFTQRFEKFKRVYLNSQ